MGLADILPNVAFKWTTVATLAFWFQPLLALESGTGPSLSTPALRSTATASVDSDVSLIWQRPVLKEPVLINGSLALQSVNISGKHYCNSVCGSMMDYAMVADVSGSVGNPGVVGTQLFLGRLMDRLRIGQGNFQQLVGIIEAGMQSRLLTGEAEPLRDTLEKVFDGINKLKFQGGALDLVEALGLAKTSFTLGRKHAHSLVLAIVDGPAYRHRLTLEMAERVSQVADLVVILVADEFDEDAIRKATEWLQSAGSCTPYGCRLLTIDSYESLAAVDTTSVLAEICRDLV